MGSLLRVINIEDSQPDSALLRRHLTQAGFELIFERVETSEALQAALEAKEWDVILADYSLPHFNALQALALVNELRRDIPVILVSGTVGETTAVGSMLAGACDYLMKGNLARLVPAIERALSETANRRARHLAEKALKASEAELRALFAAMNDMILVLDRDGRYLKIAPTNPEYKPPHDRIGKTLHEVFPKETADFFLEHIRRSLAERRTLRVEYRLPLPDRELWFDANVAPMSADSVVWIARDMAERKRAEEEQARLNAQIKLQSQRLDNIVANVPGVVWEAWGQPDAVSQRIDFVSDYVEPMLGYSVQEWLSTPNFWLSIVHPDDRESTARAAAANFAACKNSRLEFRWIAKDGRVVWVEVNSAVITDDSGRPVGVRGVTTDISERKKLEEQLAQSQKMEAIGQLAGGIAHDFNNLLTIINGYSKLLASRKASDDPANKQLGHILKAGERAALLTQRLLAFSRRQILQLQVFGLNEVVGEIQPMLRSLIPENIDLTVLLSPETGEVRADPAQLEQVIMNLAVNARDAMPDGGKLTIETGNIELDESYARTHPETTPGRYALLTVTDNGSGMTESIQAHIFEPFFTTKEVGKGTGLGLAMVYGFVRQSGGHIFVYSEPAAGTSFKIYIPSVSQPVQNAKHELPGVVQEEGNETVLLVEDDEGVREFALEILAERGYDVIPACNGDEALAKSAALDRAIDLLITDVVMPGMSGRQVAEHLQAERPRIKVLYMSGYTDDAVVRHGILDPGVAFLPKPISPEALVQKVRKVLDTPIKTPVVLVADDEESIRILLKDLMEEAGYEVLTASDGDEALKICRGTTVDLLITDLAMPNKDGIETIRALRRDLPRMKMIAVSGMYGTAALLEAAKKFGAVAVFQKPLDLETVVHTVNKLLRPNL